MMGLIGRVWTRGMPVELTGTNSPKAYTFVTESCFCLRPLYGFEAIACVGLLLLPPVWGGASLVYGGYSERETPGSIPNPEVKALCADGTALVTVWESRSLPVFDWDTGRARA